MTPATLGTLYYVSEWAVRLSMLVFVPQRRSTAASRTWLLLIFLLPWPGLIIYALLGRIRVPTLRREKQALASQAIRRAESRALAERFTRGAVPSHFASAATLAEATGDFAALAGNQLRLLSDYSAVISLMIADIDAAHQHVHMLFYIFEDDETGRSVAAALTRAALRGVRCRLLIDAVGGRGGLARVAPQLRASGVEVHAMLPVGLFRRRAERFDLRNHRKIAVVDGRIGYTGSQNIVDSGFVAGYPNEELVAQITGPAVAQLQAVFLTDWFLETNERLAVETFVAGVTTSGNSTAQVQPSGPGYPRENTRDLLVELLYAARTRVVITTPYFIPDEPFLLALQTAATRGVDVHLVLSKHGNQRLTQTAQRAYYDDLLAAGIRVHHYLPHFLHAKHVSVDDQVVVLGTVNIDIRSFALNAEVSLIVFDPVVAGDLARIQERYFANSELLDAEGWRRRPLVQRVMQNVARLADSFL